MRATMGPPMGGSMGDMGGPGTISPGPMSGHGPGWRDIRPSSKISNPNKDTKSMLKFLGGLHPDSPLGGGGGGPPSGMGGTVPMGPSSHPLMEPSSPHPYGIPR